MDMYISITDWNMFTLNNNNMMLHGRSLRYIQLDGGARHMNVCMYVSWIDWWLQYMEKSGIQTTRLVRFTGQISALVSVPSLTSVNLRAT